VTIAGSPFAVGGLAQASNVAAQTAGWQVYQDADYGFTLEYPAEWKPEITIDIRDPHPKPEWVLRRYTFIGDLGGLDIDISAAQGMDLSTWLKWVGEITAPFPVTEPNAKVAGYPAVAFAEKGVGVHDGALSVFVSDGQYVYRFWYTAIYSEDGLRAYQHILDTFRLPGTIAAGAEIPQPVIQKAQQVLESGNTPMQSCQSVYNQGCCGLSSTYCSTYFPCSRLNGVDKGNCTWYVCYQYGAIPFRGNAGTWWGQVPTYASWRRGTRPQRGLANIAWWGGDPGHVAYVGDYQGGEQVTISEMSWCNSCGRTRTIPVTDPWGYIWRATGPTRKGEEPENFGQ